MTLRDTVGQLFMVGFPGTTVTTQMSTLMDTYKPGGVILFSRNLHGRDQIVRLTNQLQKHSLQERLLIAVDQEGGRVSRLPRGFTIFPSCATIGRYDSSELAYAAASTTATELRAVGINMNMAPVLDVNTNPDNPVIGDRAFSSSPTQVAAMGLATIAGLQDNKVLACGKHFPGHGDTSVDSHEELPTVGTSAERLREIELRPFAHAIENGLVSIMTAHVQYPSLDDRRPATLSPYILSELLRNELGFRGLVLSDDLEMRAIRDHFGIGEAAVLALKAGADMILVCSDADLAAAAMETVFRAVKTGEISEARLEASFRRVANLKRQFLHPYTPAESRTAKTIVGCPAHKTVLESILKASERPVKARV